MPLVKEWQKRPQQSVYAVIFLDGNKDVLGIWFGENESAKFWLSVLNE
ncbi:transposase and inactivated derivative [Paenibacillus popilliae ATCC 14706]|uniref:Transposase and inactivated derivative n=1 Tax=Paenibacillus popilliae ATCC 14706 TaxID=1212764 RepID=M9M5Y9_PAEPP|nr:transposase and inactivated derivative [Paenibacillus popilliae ATCC 14706]